MIAFMGRSNEFVVALLGVIAVLLGPSLFGSAASAAVVDIGDFSGNETVIDFTDIDMKALGNPADIGFGITVLSKDIGGGRSVWKHNADWSVFFDNIPGASLGKALADNAATSDLTYNLSQGVHRFGLLLSTSPQTTWTVSFYDTNDILIATTQVSMPADGDAVFIGYESLDRFIGSINITDPGNDAFVTIMDDVRFEICLFGCCLPDLTCQLLSQTECLSQGGLPQSDGSDCTTGNCPCPPDINGTGEVNVLDLLRLLLCFGLPAVPGCEAEDVNGDGTVNVLDLIDVLLAFGASCG